MRRYIDIERKKKLHFRDKRAQFIAQEGNQMIVSEKNEI